jgi:uncharacterized protein
LIAAGQLWWNLNLWLLEGNGMSQPYYSDSSVARVQQGLMQRVFSWMFAGLFMTAIIAYVLSQNENVTQYLLKNQMILFGIWIVNLLLVIGLSFLLQRLSVFAATFAFFLYAGLNGVSFSLILAYFHAGTIYAAFFIAAGMFGLFAVLGYVTKIDLTRIGSIAIMLLIGIILASLVNVFWLKSSMLGLIISYVLVALFCIITAYDIQNIKRMSREAYDEDTAAKMAIFGALMLYIDFILIFQNLLQILSSDD